MKYLMNDLRELLKENSRLLIDLDTLYPNDKEALCNKEQQVASNSDIQEKNLAKTSERLEETAEVRPKIINDSQIKQANSKIKNILSAKKFLDSNRLLSKQNLEDRFSKYLVKQKQLINNSNLNLPNSNTLNLTENSERVLHQDIKNKHDKISTLINNFTKVPKNVNDAAKEENYSEGSKNKSNLKVKRNITEENKQLNKLLDDVDNEEDEEECENEIRICKEINKK